MPHNHSRSNKSINVAFFLNLSFTIVEIIGGLMTNSVSILADAVHDLGDSVSLAVAAILQKTSNKKRTESFTYGFKRLSLLGALINSAILVIGSTIVLSQTLPRLFAPEEVNENGMLLLSLFGITINGLGVMVTRNGKGMNEKVVNLHLLEDVLGWAAVLFVSIVMQFGDWYILDPLLAIVINLVIFKQAFKALRSVVKIFLQGVPNNIDMHTVTNQINTQQYVKGIHDIHVWSLDGDNVVFSAHIDISNETNLVETKKIIKEILKNNHIHHSTIEFEYKEEECAQENC